ncbi:MAG: AMP-binding protein, partial [bacterium]|nr:AMP-binding protein [bacterium]
ETITGRFVRPFRISQPPLFRVELIKTGDRHGNERHILMLDMHHIISDGLSMELFIKEFIEIYAGKEPAPFRLQYKDFSQWQNSRQWKELNKTREAYWLKQYEGEKSALNLPTDYPRPPVWRFEGKTAAFRIEKQETRQLQQQALQHNTTLFIELIAIYSILLSKLSGQEAIVIGTPVMGRPHADLLAIIGIFVNTLAIKNYPTGEKNIKEFLGEVRNGVLKALENQEYPFEDLVEKVTGEIARDTGRNPLFDVMFSMLETENTAAEIPGLTLRPYEFENPASKFDMTFFCKPVNETLHFSVEYSTNLFKPGTIRRIITYFKKLLLAILHDPRAKIAQLEIVPEEEKRQILNEFNNTAAPYPKDKTIHEMFEEQVERKSGATAITAGAISLNYSQLNESANQIAARLIEKGVTTETIVAIIVERTLEMVAGIFGILKAGAAYLPISPTHPEERIAFILRDSNSKMILTREDAMEKIKTGAEAKNQEKEKPELQVGDRENRQPGILLLEEFLKPKEAAAGTGDKGDRKKEQETQTKLQSQQSSTRSSNLAYIIYTSGSTGKPKGVLIEHTSVVNILTALHRQYPFSETDTYLFKTSYVFDVSVSEIFGWIPGGGRMA